MERRRPSLERLQSIGRREALLGPSTALGAAKAKRAERAAGGAGGAFVPDAPSEPPPNEALSAFEFPESSYSYRTPEEQRAAAEAEGGGGGSGGSGEGGDVSIRGERRREAQRYAAEQAAAIYDPTTWVFGATL